MSSSDSARPLTPIMMSIVGLATRPGIEVLPMCSIADDFAAFIGLDWADRKHDVCLHAPGLERFERGVLEHHPAAIEAWARALKKRFGGKPIAIGLELSRGPIVSAL